jgi:epsilon-lactone hydrolase
MQFFLWRRAPRKPGSKKIICYGVPISQKTTTTTTVNLISFYRSSHLISSWIFHKVARRYNMKIRLTSTTTTLLCAAVLLLLGQLCTTAALTIGGKISLQSTNESSSTTDTNTNANTNTTTSSTTTTNTNASTSSNSTTTDAVNSTENETETTTTTTTTPLWAHIPDTISPEWGPVILEQGAQRELQFPPPDDIETWQAIQKSFVAQEAAADAIAAEYGVTYKEKELGGIPVIDIVPPNLVCKDKIAVYIHGGGYVIFSAKSAIEAAILFAVETNLRVISIDYTLAPQSKWQDTTDEVIRVFAALAELGFNAKTDVVMFGDSAGGSMVASVTLKMRDLGMDMPAALILLSPWADITVTGDTYVTLRDAEPFYTYKGILEPASLAYANVEDHKNPFVSPVYGDFTKGFPPTLIQGGTKELLLSNFVRLYQAIDQAGGTVKLDIYEGMPHVFQFIITNSTESQAAMTKARKWVKKYLLSA